jgi:hypothetical protein
VHNFRGETVIIKWPPPGQTPAAMENDEECEELLEFELISILKKFSVCFKIIMLKIIKILFYNILKNNK